MSDGRESGVGATPVPHSASPGRSLAPFTVRPLNETADERREAAAALAEAPSQAPAKPGTLQRDDGHRHLGTISDSAPRDSVVLTSVKKRRLSLQSPAVQRVGRIDLLSSPAPQSPFGFSFSTPVAFVNHRRGLVEVHPTPCKKLVWSTLPSMHPHPSTAPRIEAELSQPTRIWNISKLPVKQRSQLMIALGIRFLYQAEFASCREFIGFELHRASRRDELVSSEELEFVLVLFLHSIWCFRARPPQERLQLCLRDASARPFFNYYTELVNFLILRGSLSESNWKVVLSLLNKATASDAVPNTDDTTTDCSAELSVALSQICPERIDFKSNIAVMKLLRGQKKEALLAMRQLISADKRNCLILNNYAVLLMQRAEFSSAISLLQSCLHLDDTCVQLRAQTYTNLYIALACNGDTHAAEQALQNAASADNRRLYSTRFNVAAHLLTAAVGLVELDDRTRACRSAQRLLKELLAEQPSSKIYTYLGKACSLLASDEDEEESRTELRLEASEHFMQAVRLSPTDPMPWNEFGRLAFLDTDCRKPLSQLPNLHFSTARKAERIFNSVLSEYPSHVGILCNYGIALHLSHKFTEAEAVYKKALSLDPNSISAWNNLGNVYRDSGRADLAQKAFEHCLQIDDRATNAYINLALHLIVQNRLGEAQKLLEKALHIDNSNVCARSNLVKLRLLRKDIGS